MLRAVWSTTLLGQRLLDDTYLNICLDVASVFFCIMCRIRQLFCLHDASIVLSAYASIYLSRRRFKDGIFWAGFFCHCDASQSPEKKTLKAILLARQSYMLKLFKKPYDSTLIQTLFKEPYEVSMESNLQTNPNIWLVQLILKREIKYPQNKNW